MIGMRTDIGSREELSPFNFFIMKKYYKLTRCINEEDSELLVVADDYADAVKKAMALEDFDYLFGEGFKIVCAGEILI